MRIGIDARLWSESGVGRYTRNLVAQLQILDRKNEYVLFVLTQDAEEILNQVQNDSFRIVKSDIRWHTVEEQVRFPSILNQEKLDLVHFPYFSVPIFYNRPFVVTIHDLILHHFPTGEASTLPFPFYHLKLLGYKFVISQAAKKAAKIITVSNATKEEIIKHLGVSSEKVVVTYEGVDQHIAYSKSRMEENHKLSAISDKPYFLYVGNAYPHKNLERLLQAFTSLCHPERGEGSRFFGREPQNDIRLILVGREDYFYKRLKEKVKKMGLLEHVIFYGYATEEELRFLYKNALALVMPSLMEGFGLPIVEAISQKCLVLASDIPVHREIAGDAALYFDPRNVEDMSRKMIPVYLNDIYHLSDKIQNGLERAKMFSWEKMARETLSLYESCSSTGSE